MNIKFATLVAHDGTTLIKVNPFRVNYLVSLDNTYTKIHFGLDQTLDVAGSLEAVVNALSEI